MEESELNAPQRPPMRFKMKLLWGGVGFLILVLAVDAIHPLKRYMPWARDRKGKIAKIAID